MIEKFFTTDKRFEAMIQLIDKIECLETQVAELKACLYEAKGFVRDKKFRKYIDYLVE